MRASVAGALAGIAIVCGAIVARAQQAPSDSLRCDSIVGAARVDSISTGLFVSVTRRDGLDIGRDASAKITSVVGAAFVPPRPFRLTTFSGPPGLRFLRHRATDTTTELRAPTVTGVYRVWVGKAGPITPVATLRASLMPGFDSAAVEAIWSATTVGALVPRDDEESMWADLRFSTDSVAGSRRFISADFPRMRVIDAVPRTDNPVVEYPEESKADSEPSGDVVLRFVVLRTGDPAVETIELVRGMSANFVKAALAAMSKLRFAPATIRGCAVAQTVEYVFNFLAPEPPPRH